MNPMEILHVNRKIENAWVFAPINDKTMAHEQDQAKYWNIYLEVIANLIKRKRPQTEIIDFCSLALSRAVFRFA